MKSHVPNYNTPDHLLKSFPAQYPHILDALPALVFAINRDGYITYANKAWCMVIGFKPEDIMGRHILRFIIDSDHKKTIEYLEKQISGCNISHFENLFIHKEGRPVPVSWAGRWSETEGTL